MDATAGSEAAGHRCQTCGLEFRDEALIREHYKSDLHLYNLRRRSAGLAPVDAALFARKQAAAAAAVAARAAEETAAPKTFACPYSRKVFKSKAQFDQYQRSKKFLQLKVKAEAAIAKAAEAEAAAAESGAGGSEVDALAGGSKAASLSTGSSEDGSAAASASSARKEPKWDTMTVFTHCMFDNSPVDGLADHLQKARKSFGFLIPDEEYLVDLKGLMEYCMAKIIGGAECLYCSRRFSGPAACQQHMRDCAHCRLPMDVGGGELMDEYAAFFDLDAKDAKSGWLADGVEMLPTGELRLASGRVLGTKGMRRYYTQRHRPTAPKDASVRRAIVNNRVETESRFLRKWAGEEAATAMVEASAGMHMSDMVASRVAGPSILSKAEKAARSDAHAARKVHDEHKLKTGLLHNKTQTKHFRIQNFQYG